MPASESVFVERGPKNVKTTDEEGPSARTFDGGARVGQEIAGDVHSRVQVLAQSAEESQDPHDEKKLAGDPRTTLARTAWVYSFQFGDLDPFHALR